MPALFISSGVTLNKHDPYWCTSTINIHCFYILNLSEILDLCFGPVNLEQFFVVDVFRRSNQP